MAASAERLAGALGAAADAGAVVDIWRSFGALTLDVVGTTAFGVNFDTLARSEEEEEGDGDGAASAQAGGGRGESRIKSAAAEKLVAAARTAFAVGGAANWPVLFQFLFPHLDAPLRLLTSRIPTRLRRQVPGGTSIPGLAGCEGACIILCLCRGVLSVLTVMGNASNRGDAWHRPSSCRTWSPRRR